MSCSKSQLNLNERTKTGQSDPNDLEIATPSSVSTKTRESFKAAFFNFMRDFKKRHKNKQYQYVMRLGARRWRGMTQASRAPYVLEAARNRRINNTKPKSTKKYNTKKKKDTHSKKSQRRQSPPSRPSIRRCPACGHRKKSPRSSSSSLYSSNVSCTDTTISTKSSKST